MNGFLAIFAPVAFLLPLAGHGEAARSDGENARLDPKFAPLSEPGRGEQDRTMLDAPYDVPVQQQVRIERRVIVRIAPQPPASRQSLMAKLPQRPIARRFEERKMEKCVPVAGLAGVQTGSGNRLLLFLRDRRIVSASLEKSCRARDFYSGFYLERNEDGKLCVDRDKLQSRSGAKCEIDRMRHLVPVSD